MGEKKGDERKEHEEEGKAEKDRIDLSVPTEKTKKPPKEEDKPRPNPGQPETRHKPDE